MTPASLSLNDAESLLLIKQEPHDQSVLLTVKVAVQHVQQAIRSMCLFVYVFVPFVKFLFES